MLNAHELRIIAEKVMEMGKLRYRSGEQSSITSEQREALLGWGIIGLRDDIEAMEALGYAIVKTTVGIFVPLAIEKETKDANV